MGWLVERVVWRRDQSLTRMLIAGGDRTLLTTTQRNAATCPMPTHREASSLTVGMHMQGMMYRTW